MNQLLETPKDSTKRSWSERDRPTDNSVKSSSPELKVNRKMTTNEDIMKKLVSVETTVNANATTLTNLQTENKNLRRDLDGCKKENAELRELIRCLDSRLSRTERGLENVKDKTVDLTYRQMRINMVIYKLPERNGEDCKQIVNEFFVSKMKIDKFRLSKDIIVDVAHRFGRGHNRPIVVRFTTRTGKIEAMKHCRNLKGEDVFVKDQLPSEMQDQTSTLVPQMKAIKASDKTSKVSIIRGNLYVNGVRQESSFAHNKVTVDADDLSSSVKLSSFDKGDYCSFNGTNMQAHFYPDATDLNDIKTALAKIRTDKKVSAADHIIYAYRITDSYGSTLRGYDDDREYGVSKLLLDLLEHHNAEGVLIISKQDGPLRLKDRHKTICQIAEDLLSK